VTFRDTQCKPLASRREKMKILAGFNHGLQKARFKTAYRRAAGNLPEEKVFPQ